MPRVQRQHRIAVRNRLGVDLHARGHEPRRKVESLQKVAQLLSGSLFRRAAMFQRDVDGLDRRDSRHRGDDESRRQTDLAHRVHAD